jgi:dTDP-glucose pyrophosphorylase
MKKPILVVLAAGMGSRYGGLKQMDAIGRGGEALLDYSVYDALRSGFEKIVFIIRHDFEADFRRIVLGRMGGITYELAYQELDSLIPPEPLAESRRIGRTKPWGTTHALLCAEKNIDAPFAVINADDFYGREAFTAMGGCLSSGNAADGAIVPYRLSKTLSPQGTVTRGICEVKDGFLRSVNELKAIEKQGGVVFNTGEDGIKQALPEDTPVSMNFWGFPSGIFPRLREYFDDFLKAFMKSCGENSAGASKAECYLPMAADWFIKNGYLKIRVLDADPVWFGVTYKEDRETAVNRVAALVSQGVYPPRLWD